MLHLSTARIWLITDSLYFSLARVCMCKRRCKRTIPMEVFGGSCRQDEHAITLLPEEAVQSSIIVVHSRCDEV